MDLGRKAGRKAVFYPGQVINSWERHLASFSHLSNRDVIISFQLTSLVEIKCCTRFSGFLLVQMKSLPSFSHSAILFGLLLGALAAIPPVTAVVDLSYSLPLDCKLLQVTAWFTPLRMVQRTGA